jgi:thymidylate synthase (FAD)
LVNKKYVGEGKVVLIAGGGRIYTDLAARFVTSEKSLDDLIASPYDKKLLSNIINSGHKSATEFDYFLFGVEGYARVTEVQLVRKRIASYMIKTGRMDKGGKRSYDVVIPKNIESIDIDIKLAKEKIYTNKGRLISDLLLPEEEIFLTIDTNDILNILKEWYEQGVFMGYSEGDLRYLKPQATEFKALIGMNAHALKDWFQIRCCMNAADEIRDMAYKMLNLCKEVAPDLFVDAGRNCFVLGYCPENNRQNEKCKKAGIITKNKALQILKQYKLQDIVEP